MTRPLVERVAMHGSFSPLAVVAILAASFGAPGCTARDKGSESNFSQCSSQADCEALGRGFECVSARCVCASGNCDAGSTPETSAADARLADGGGREGGEVAPECASDGGWSPLAPGFCTIRLEDSTLTPPPGAVFGRITALEPDHVGQDCTGVPGVQVCAFQTATCATSDANGDYVLQGIPTGEQEITFGKDGYYPVVRQIVTGSAALKVGTVLLPTAAAERYAACAGASGDGRRGQILLNIAGTSDVEGITVTLSPAAGSGPHYLLGGSDPATLFGLDPSRTATGPGNATVPDGVFWYDVDPGDYLLHFATGQPAFDLTPYCFPMSGVGWKTSPDGVPRVRVHAGFESHVLVVCVKQ